MHIHILGICGTFMGGVAQLARAAGHRVTGCDAGVYPPMSTQLEASGIELIEGYGAAQVDLQPDCFVIGNAISRGNPLLEEILDRGLPYVSGPQWLADHVLRGRWVLAVAGTHGKTTTASMLAWILEDAGLSPGFLIGGVPRNFGVSARLHGALADSPFFVIEADEYDTAFCDKRSKFVHYRPRTAVLNNLEFDHADIFGDLDAIEPQCHHLVRTLPRQGLIVANGGEASLGRVLARGCWPPVERFNVADGWQMTGDDATGALHLMRGDEPVATTQWLVGFGRTQRGQGRSRAPGGAPRRGAAGAGHGGAVALRERQAADGVARHGTGRQCLRRFRASSNGDRDDARRPEKEAGHGTHPGGSRTALEHDEARRHESPVAGQPGRGRPGLLLCGEPWLGCG
jgi:UDP-N-acetylmuramate:L-alanyl-gamma-D-glutamyl-meso-diaminopimelate ligase